MMKEAKLPPALSSVKMLYFISDLRMFTSNLLICACVSQFHMFTSPLQREHRSHGSVGCWSTHLTRSDLAVNFLLISRRNGFKNITTLYFNRPYKTQYTCITRKLHQLETDKLLMTHCRQIYNYVAEISLTVKYGYKHCRQVIIVNEK